MDQHETSKRAGRARRRVLAAPLVVVAVGGVAAGCGGGSQKHLLIGSVAITTTTVAPQIAHGAVPVTGPIGEDCGNGVIVTGLCAQTPGHSAPGK